MTTTLRARAALAAAVITVISLAAATPAAAAPNLLRDVTAEQCRAAGGQVQGSGYCVGGDGEDAWGQPIDGQGVNPNPRPGFED
ncbi:hypothetical protein ACPC54_25730 [Kitasatospora sp. NPDC094028]